jgi:hypothetical protein
MYDLGIWRGLVNRNGGSSIVELNNVSVVHINTVSSITDSPLFTFSASSLFEVQPWLLDRLVFFTPRSTVQATINFFNLELTAEQCTYNIVKPFLYFSLNGIDKKQ